MSELSINLISVVFGAVITAIIGCLAYFAKRHIEKTDKGQVDSFLDGYERLREIAESKNPPTATSNEIQNLHEMILSIQNSTSDISKEPIIHEGAWTQADLNRIGGAEFAEADARVNLTYAKLKSYQDGSCAEALESALEKWKEFRHEYSVFIAETYSGGSIQPLMYTSTAVEITNQFNSLLNIELKDRASM